MRPRTPARRLFALSGALLLGLSLAACGDDSGDDAAGDTSSEGGGDDCGGSSEATRSFEADNGTVEIPEDPQRIVATGYAVPVLLEADACLVGISEWGRGTNLMTDDDLAQYEEMEKVAGETADTTNYESIANLGPDLIILGVPVPALADLDMERLESVAPVVVLGPDRPDAWNELSQRQADAAGELDYYDAAKAAYDERAAELREKFADVLDGLQFGHVGGYGDVTAGNFQREFAGSWGTNVAGDVGATYYGEVAEPGPGSAAVSEYPAIEELPESLGEADVITYTLQDDGTPSESVQYVLDSPLWDGLPAVQNGMTIGIRNTEAATYPTALQTLDEIDAVFSEAFADQLP